MNRELAMSFCSMSVGTMTPTSLSSLTRSLLGFEIFDSTIFIWEGKFGKYFFG